MPENSKTWFRLRWRTLFLLAIVGVVGWSAYSYWSEYSEQAARKARELMAPVVGAKCIVELGDSNSVSGLFVKLNDEWIVLHEELPKSKGQVWIPRESVHHMRVEPKK